MGTEPGLCSEREMRRGDWTPCREKSMHVKVLTIVIISDLLYH